MSTVLLGSLVNIAGQGSNFLDGRDEDKPCSSLDIFLACMKTLDVTKVITGD